MLRRRFALPQVALLLAIFTPMIAWSQDESASSARREDDVDIEEDLTAVVLFSSGKSTVKLAAALSLRLRQTMTAARAAGQSKIPPVAKMAPKNDGMLIIEGDQRLLTARKYLGRGLDYILEGDRKRAYDEFHRGLHYYRSGYPYAEDDALYRNLLFYLAAASDSQKNKREKTKRDCEHFGLSLELANKAAALPALNEVLIECDWEIDDPDIKTLTMRTSPSGARIYIDGVYRGVTPTEIDDLRRGEHLFTFHRDGYRRVSRVMMVGAKFAETAELDLGLSLKTGVYNYLYTDLLPIIASDAKPDGKLLKDAAIALEVENLLLIQVHAGRPGKPAVRTMLYNEGTNAISRERIPAELTDDGMLKAIPEIISRHYGAQVTDKLALSGSTSALYFKLKETPFVVPEED